MIDIKRAKYVMTHFLLKLLLSVLFLLESDVAFALTKSLVFSGDAQTMKYTLFQNGAHNFNMHVN